MHHRPHLQPVRRGTGQSCRAAPGRCDRGHLRSLNKHGIVLDEFRGSKLAVRHLIGLDHQRVVFFSDALGHFDAGQRLEGQ